MSRKPKPPVFGSCIYCREEYQIKYLRGRGQFSWCRCPGALDEKHRVKVIQCRESRHRMEKDPVRRAHRKRYLQAYNKEYRNALFPAKMHLCPRCRKELTVNRFACHTCHTKIDYDLDFSIDTGESHRMGVRG